MIVTFILTFVFFTVSRLWIFRWRLRHSGTPSWWTYISSSVTFFSKMSDYCENLAQSSEHIFSTSCFRQTK